MNLALVLFRMLYGSHRLEPYSMRVLVFRLSYYLRKQKVKVFIAPLSRMCTSTAQTRLSFRIVKYRTVSAEHIADIRRMVVMNTFIKRSKRNKLCCESGFQQHDHSIHYLIFNVKSILPMIYKRIYLSTNFTHIEKRFAYYTIIQ